MFGLKTYVHYIIVIVSVLLVPVIPFLLFGEQMETYISRQLVSNERFNSPVWVGGAAILLLAVDILLPIPSSVVCTIAGKVLGVIVGTMICWLGLNLSAWLGYWLTSKYGWRFVRKMTDQQSREQVQTVVERSSWLTLVGFRPIPILAEASILLAGCYGLQKRSFWPPVLIGNFVVAVSFVGLGKLSSDQGWFAMALPISICLPLAMLLTWWLFWAAKK